ncbi:hypothetical protein Bca52824_075962 [Brassica carinata]|uniref:Uncharacterized protein n=1 Tax=Brassica carinata TaxID=52824 RepID=A0A8X7PU51_BRACI|nr:hypothetical protein Bca52824_075962 [Brassica carinata]
MGLVTEEVRAKAEKYTGDEICREKTKVFLKEISMPNGLLPLKDIEEVELENLISCVFAFQFIIDSGASEANLDRKRAAKAAADRKRAADKKKKDKKFNAAVKECKKNTLYEKTLRMLGIKK